MRKLIPFWLMPGSWGLKGKTREIAKAEYYLEGEELERKLVQLKYDDDTAKKLALLEIDKKYNKISDEDYEFKYAELYYDNQHDRDLATLEIRYKYGHLSRIEYEKEKANLNNEPWVGVINDEFDPSYGVNGFSFELDWNQQFVEFLKSNGYTGETEEHIVEHWFEDVSQSELELMYQEDEEAAEYQGPDYSIAKTNVHKKRTDDGKTEYS